MVNVAQTDLRIETGRLVLRGIRPADAAALFRYRSDPDVNRYQGWKPEAMQDAEDFISNRTVRTPNQPDTWYQFGIVIKGIDELIGDIGIHFLGPDNRQAEIGYSLSPENQGHGYASEAVSSVLGYLLEELGKHRVTASVDPRNTRSAALLKRVGMREEAHYLQSVWFNGEWADDVVYAVLKEEWHSK